jgi:RNA 3'-terminal phosphate cyclase (ATP)
MILIDGSEGEGGGQMLRSALGLSMRTGEAFTIKKIRAGRSKPGLMRQHLTAVNAAVKLCDATVSGDRIGSSELVFKPGAVKHGSYRFAVGTAGSTSLVLQTVLPALLMMEGESQLTLEGGTYGAFAPPFDFLKESFLPCVERAGAGLSLEMRAPGFYPAGGGSVLARVSGRGKLKGFSLMERGELKGQKAVAHFAHIDPKAARECLSLIQGVMGWPDSALKMRQYTQCSGPGFVVTVHLEYEHVTEVITGFGAGETGMMGISGEVVKEAKAYLASTAPVGEHLADQVMLPLALAAASGGGGGEFRCVFMSGHSRTHVGLIEKFLGVGMKVEEREDGVVVRVG